MALDFAADAYPSDARGLLLVALPAIAVYAIWCRALALVPSGQAGAIRLAGILALIQAGLANGLAGLFPCPPVALWGGDPPCALAPWQDFAHLGSLIFGVGGFLALRRLTPTGPGHRRLLWTGISLLVVHTTLAAVVAATN